MQRETEDIDFALLVSSWREFHSLREQLLRDGAFHVTTDRKVLQVAYDVGYESEAAFSRAFRRAFGMPPARYRGERRAQRN